MKHAKWVLVVLYSAIVASVVWWQTTGGTPAYAQQAAAATGSVQGRVTDSTGAIFQGAEVTLEKKGGGAPLGTQSNEEGYYRFPYVGPGDYTLTARKTGFSDVVIPHLVVEVQRTATLDIVMNPGKVVQEINVSASATSLQTQSSSLSGVVDSRTETQLPLPMRDPSQLINLVAGVTNDNRNYLGGTTNAAGGLSYQSRLSFTMNGGGRAQGISMVDGVDVTVDAGDFSSVPIVPTPDFTQEFSAQTNNQPAQFGRGSGILNIVTRSGTNSFHGTVFEFLQNNVLNANNLFANKAGQKIPHLQRNQYGAALGGPVIIPHLYNGKDKTFWFFNIERMHELGARTVVQRLPTAAELRGDFSNDYTTAGALVPIYNPYSVSINPATGAPTRAQFPNNTIPANMIQPWTSNFLKYYPQPNNPGTLGTGGVNTGIGNFTATGSMPVDWNRLDVKIDENLTANHRFMFRYSKSLFHVEPIDFYHNFANPYALSNRINFQPGMNMVGSWTWTASPTLVINQAINISRFADRSISLPFDPTSLGGPFADGAIADYERRFNGYSTFPYLQISGYAPQGPTGPYEEPYINYAYQFGLTKIRGKHTLSAGFQFTYLTGSESNYGQQINLIYGGGFTNGPNPLTPSANTGNGFADFLLGTAASSTAMVTAWSQYTTSKYAAWYVQDDLRVTPKLTLNLGVRYDFTTPLMDRWNQFYRWNPLTPNALQSAIGPNTNGQSLNQYFMNLSGRPLQGAIVFPNTPGSAGRGIVPTDWSNIAPRLGFAYSPTSKMVIRGGLARLYSLTPVAPAPFSGAVGPFGATTNPIVTAGDGYTPVVNPTNLFPSGLNVPTGDTLGPFSLLGQSITGGSTTSWVTPYYNQWNIGIERQLPGNMNLGIAYAGGEAHRLICPHGGCGTDQIPANLLAQYGSKTSSTVPNPFYGIITNPTSSLSRATVQLGQLLKQWPAYTNVGGGVPGITQGLRSDHDTFHNSFEALEVQFNKRFSHGLQLIAAFTWSKTLTNADGMDAGYLGPYVGYQNFVDFQREWSMSAEDVPKSFVIGHVFDLPFGRGRALGSNWAPVLDKTLGHWQFSGITTFRSGYPMAISETGHTTGAFGGGDRPNLIGDPCVSGVSRSARIAGGSLNPAAFQTPPNYTWGNASRTLPCLRDGIKNMDWSLIKVIPIKEAFNIEFRAEAFNAFNRPQLGAPNTTYKSSAFGQVTSQFNAPRVIQFGLKLKW